MPNSPLQVYGPVPSEPRVHTHSWGSQDDQGVFITQVFRSPEIKRGPDVRQCPTVASRASSPVRSSQPPLSRHPPVCALRPEPCALPAQRRALRHLANGQVRSWRRVEVASLSRQFPFIPFWGGKNHIALFVPQPRRAQSRAYGHLALRICVIGRVFCGCLRVCSTCVCLRPGAGNKRASVKFDNKVLRRSCQD